MTEPHVELPEYAAERARAMAELPSLQAATAAAEAQALAEAEAERLAYVAAHPDEFSGED